MRNKLKQFKKIFKIGRIVAVDFRRRPPPESSYHVDTYCTALARTFFGGETLVFGRGCPQACAGGNYFFSRALPKREVEDFYLEEEKSFGSRAACRKFLSALPRLPEKLWDQYLVLEEFTGSKKAPVLLFLVDPAQAGRLLGLLAFKRFYKLEILPGQPACVSLFAPLSRKGPHLNLIDHYDREYQGRQGGKKLWPENKLLLSLSYQDFQEILSNMEKSFYGASETGPEPALFEAV